MTQHQICPARSLDVSKNSKNKLPLYLAKSGAAERMGKLRKNN
jgi:hypothetical protein